MSYSIKIRIMGQRMMGTCSEIACQGYCCPGYGENKNKKGLPMEVCSHEVVEKAQNKAFKNWLSYYSASKTATCNLFHGLRYDAIKYTLESRSHWHLSDEVVPSPKRCWGSVVDMLMYLRLQKCFVALSKTSWVQETQHCGVASPTTTLEMGSKESSSPALR